MATRSASLRKFLATLPEDGEPHICPPGCRVDHDAKYANRPRVKMVPRQPSKTPKQLALIGIACPGSETPTVKALMKHARMYGSHGVDDIARLHCLEMPPEFEQLPKRLAVRKSAKGVPRRTQAKNLLALGHSWTVIEDTLDLPRSVSSALRKELCA